MSVDFSGFAALLTRETGYCVNQSRFRVSALQSHTTMYERIKYCKYTFVAILNKLFKKRPVSFYGLVTIKKLQYLIQIDGRPIEEIPN